ncbi:Metallo-dependent phosphatase-like protein [Staphylotrichum tortipilum]|uniref:Metallo-dependent phosphatase-like protein n=1 Tax=Staphylotrichum tortipilum TaxID=2831512 RepID=A0AAN6RPN9_9PEZI|nr:Metallo-dependent phosphatase-like protein [Staphylotrichum longicolle]
MAQFLPSSNRRRPRRHVLAPALGGIATLLTVLTLCVFASHLPALQRATSGARPLSGGTAGRPRVVTPRDAVEPAPEPHHASLLPPTPPPPPAATAHEGRSELEVILSIIDEQIKQAESWPDHMEYGANKHPPFKDDPPMLVADLPKKYIPSYSPPTAAQGEEPVDGASKTSARRLVIVGDVHGYLVPLKALLRKVGFDNKNGDHLILAGDIVTKGPDSKGVVKLAMDLGASAVRGNQDDRVLAAAGELRRLSADDESRLGQELADAEDGNFVDTAVDDGKVDAETRRRDHARKVARSLSRAQLAWLKSHPIILRVSHMPTGGTAPWDASTLVVVHGGLVPGVRLEKQDAWAVMNMRSLVYPGKGKRKGKGRGKKHHTQSELTHTDDERAAHTTPGADDATIAPESVAVPVDGRKGEPWSHAW